MRGALGAPHLKAIKMAETGSINSEQLLAVYRAALSVAHEWELEPVLQRIADQSREMVNTRYAAIGVTHDDLRIRLFVTSGIDDATRDRIGPLPEGKGLLGAIIHGRKPLRIPSMSNDPRSIGFPPNHPPMTSLLGVPVSLGDRVLGNLYLCDRIDGEPFSSEDQLVVETLAANAAAAIDRAEMMQKLADAHAVADLRWDHMRTLLEQLPVGVYVPGVKPGEVQFINSEAKRLFGVAGNNTRSNETVYLTNESGVQVSESESPQTRVERGERVQALALWAGRPESVRHPVLVSAIQLEHEPAGETETVVVMQDMTRMRAADQLKSDFLSLVSHELNTPITTIIGAAHLLQSGASSLTDVDRHELLGDLVAESDRLAKMLSNLITVTAVYAGTIEAQTEPVLVDHVVNRAVEAAKRRGRERLFWLELPPGLPPVEADPGLLDHVLANIFDNSIKYGTANGHVRVRAEAMESTVVLSIDDDGPGIDPEKLTQIFERFYRADHEAPSHGLGLGLYLCRFLMEAQGGRIWAESAGPGTGMTISLELPTASGWSDDINERTPS